MAICYAYWSDTDSGYLLRSGTGGGYLLRVLSVWRCQANRAVWVGSVLPVGTFLALCRMTYWEFSWDIVEPISFFVSTMGYLAPYYTLDPRP